MMNIEKTDRLLWYILLRASQNDEYIDKKLGPIHLIKYVYLADLSYAQQHGGETYTGTVWRFHNFGPWSPEIFNRIEPALLAVSASKATVSHPKYEGDFIRWELVDEELLRKLDSELPFPVSMTVQKSVRSFGSDTASLLNHVYLTEPMLKSAPGENLNLSLICDTEYSSIRTTEKEKKPPLSRKEKEKHDKKLQDLRALMQKKLEEKKKTPELAPPDPPPKYDEIFQAGLAYLDIEAGPPLQQGEENAIISDDVWKSKSRYDPELS